MENNINTEVASILKDKLPLIEKALTNKGSIKVIQTIPGSLLISMNGLPLNISEKEMEGIETYLRLNKVFSNGK